MFGGEEDAQRVGFEEAHEVGGVGVPEGRAAADAGVGEEDVQTSVSRDGVFGYGGDGGFFRGIELACVDVDAGVERV